MRHVLSALVQNQPGVLAHISGMLASRAFNIDSLAVGETEDANLSSEDYVERDLMLISVKSAAAQRVEISLLVEMFRGRIVDIGIDSMMVEISGREEKIEAFIDLMRPYGIVELARSGRIALVRGTRSSGELG
jgi:acetolactate synthase-1/3 small subunit